MNIFDNLPQQQQQQVQQLMQMLAQFVTNGVTQSMKGGAVAGIGDPNRPTVVLARDDDGNVVRRETTTAQLLQDYIDVTKDAVDLMERQLILAHGEHVIECDQSELTNLKAHKRSRKGL